MSADGSSHPGYSRLESTSALSVMARIAEAGLMERGAVAVISGAAIRERAARRWPRKCEGGWAWR